MSLDENNDRRKIDCLLCKALPDDDSKSLQDFYDFMRFYTCLKSELSYYSYVIVWAGRQNFDINELFPQTKKRQKAWTVSRDCAQT